MEHLDVYNNKERTMFSVFLDFAVIGMLIIGLFAFFLGNIFFVVNGLEIQTELKQIKEYAAQAELNSRSCLREQGE
jgi:hypothetical protein